MRRPPPITALPSFAVTGGVAVVSLVVTLAWWGGRDVSHFVLGPDGWISEPWRLATCALFHVDAIHLLFNLYWLWTFGTMIEPIYGPLRTGGLYLFLAAGSAAGQYALSQGGVGLSGVGYGLFAFLWIAARKDRRFLDAVDRRTVELFVLWFFLCLALTLMKVWRVANVAHLAGAVLGAMAGHASFAYRAAQRRGYALAAAATFVALLVLASAGRPYVNLGGQRGLEFEARGLAALEAGEDDRARELLERAVRLDPRNARAWWNLGVAYHRLKREADFEAAARSAYALDPDEGTYLAAAAGAAFRAAREAETAGRSDDAIRLYREGVRIDARSADGWFHLGMAYAGAGRPAEAVQALERAVELDPKERSYATAREALRNAAKGK